MLADRAWVGAGRKFNKVIDLRRGYVLHDDHEHVTNDTNGSIEGRSGGGILFSKEAMSDFIVLCHESRRGVQVVAPGNFVLALPVRTNSSSPTVGRSQPGHFVLRSWISRPNIFSHFPGEPPHLCSGVLLTPVVA